MEALSVLWSAISLRVVRGLRGLLKRLAVRPVSRFLISQGGVSNEISRNDEN
jgi:hypothetical protein